MPTPDVLRVIASLEPRTKVGPRLVGGGSAIGTVACRDADDVAIQLKQAKVFLRRIDGGSTRQLRVPPL